MTDRNEKKKTRQTKTQAPGRRSQGSTTNEDLDLAWHGDSQNEPTKTKGITGLINTVGKGDTGEQNQGGACNPQRGKTKRKRKQTGRHKEQAFLFKEWFVFSPHRLLLGSATDGRWMDYLWKEEVLGYRSERNEPYVCTDVFSLSLQVRLQSRMCFTSCSSS